MLQVVRERARPVVVLLALFRAPAGASESPDADDPFAGAPALDLAALTRAVLARNPDAAVARQALVAAQAETRAATGLEDPMVAWSLAPASAFSERVDFGQTVRLSQRLPFPGKRAQAEAAALAEAEQRAGELSTVRADLAARCARLFAEDYATARAGALLSAHAALLEALTRAAHAQVASGRGAPHDVLSAELELGRVARQALTLRARQVGVRAEINGLLHRDPDAPLPAPPATLELPSEAPLALDTRVEAALARRPEIEAARASIRAAEATATSAEWAGRPDVELMAEYSSMWEMPEHQWMAGVALNLPLWADARGARTDAASARVAGARHGLERQAAAIRVEIAQATAAVDETRAALGLFETRLMPTARARVEALHVAYTSGLMPLSDLIEARRTLLDLELDQEMTRAELLERQTELRRASGTLSGDGARP